MNRPSGPRKAAKLSDSLHQHINVYALAASAARLSLLALVPPSEAKIIYRHAHVVIGYGGAKSYDLDLDHDGMTDFSIHTFIRNYACGNRGWFVFRLLETPSSNNGVMGAPPDALVKGARIGPKKSFYGREGVMAFATRLCQMTDSGGNWLHAQDRHLGMKFRIHGKVHYGWARLSVTPPHGFLHTGFTATLTGYAFETIPGKSIKAGQTHSTSDDSAYEDFGPSTSLTNPIPNTPQPRSLGMLALGAPGVALSRRKET